MVKKQLLELNISKGGGEDGITNRMLHLAVDSLCDPLTQLFQKLVLSNIFSNCWKIGIIVLVYKNKNFQTSVNNNRPVTLLSALSNVFERVISNYVSEKDFIYKLQSGFTKGHNTQVQLVHMVHSISSHRNAKMDTRGVFLDVEGAFDAIPHYLLLHKLRSYGFSHILLTYFDPIYITTDSG
jgi:hypothetical protein